MGALSQIKSLHLSSIMSPPSPSLETMPTELLRRMMPPNHASRVRVASTSRGMRSAMRNSGMVAGPSNPMLSVSVLQTPSSTPSESETMRLAAAIRDVFDKLCSVRREYTHQQTPARYKDRYALLRDILTRQQAPGMGMRLRYAGKDPNSYKSSPANVESNLDSEYENSNLNEDNARYPLVVLSIRLTRDVTFKIYIKLTGAELYTSDIIFTFPHAGMTASFEPGVHTICDRNIFSTDYTLVVGTAPHGVHGVQSMRGIVHDALLLRDSLNVFSRFMRISFTARGTFPRQILERLRQAGVNVAS